VRIEPNTVDVKWFMAPTVEPRLEQTCVSAQQSPVTGCREQCHDKLLKQVNDCKCLKSKINVLQNHGCIAKSGRAEI